MAEPDQYDSPWKDAIRLYLRPFLTLCFPGVEAGVDWSRPPEFLEQELREVVRDSDLSPQRVDQLIKLLTLEGAEKWVFLHVEVQSQPDPDLARRLFQYHNRLTERHGEPVVTLCVLADASPRFRPAAYEWEFWGCRVRFEFLSCKLLDFNELELATSLNPLAVVIRAHLAAQRTNQDSQARYDLKREITFGLYEFGHSQNEVVQLWRLVDWFLKLSESLKLAFHTELVHYEESKRMPYVSSAEEIGFEKGWVRGREDARHEGEVDLLVYFLERKFGKLPSEVDDDLRSLQENAQIRRAMELAMDSPTLGQFQETLSELLK
jgi:hypothetical protein